MVRKSSNRSYANVNRIGAYNGTDARIDNPHLTSRKLGAIIRQENGIKFRPKGKAA